MFYLNIIKLLIFLENITHVSFSTYVELNYVLLFVSLKVPLSFIFRE